MTDPLDQPNALDALDAPDPPDPRAAGAERRRRIGRLAGEPTRFTRHHLDADAGTIELRVVVRGSASLERLRRTVDTPTVEIVLPDDDRVLTAAPERFDVASTGSGATAFHRVDLRLTLPAEVVGSDEAAEAKSKPDVSHDLAARLDRIGATLDRIVALLECREADT